MKNPRLKVLLQSQIESAMKVTRSNRSAAEYLRVSYNFYKKYAKRYFNAEGKSLFEAHTNQSGKGIRKLHGSAGKQNRHKIEDILTGKHPEYAGDKFFSRLIRGGYVQEKCDRCGFCQKRPTDLKTPLILHYQNGNVRDYRIENLEVLCFNCYFVYVGRITVRDVKHFDRLMTPEPEEHIQSIIDNPERLAALSTMELLTEEEKLEIINKLSNI